jgi:O-antigen/teichoic acid export membrane protein
MTTPSGPVQHQHAPGASVARGALMLLSAQPITWAASLALVVFLPRYLGAEALGEATVLVTISSLAGAIASLGIPDYLVRLVATRPGRAATDTGAAFMLLLASSLGIASLVGGATLVLNPTMPRPAFLLMTMVGMVIITTQMPFMSLLRGQEKHARYALLAAGSAVVGVVLGLAVLAMGGGLSGYIVSSIVSYALLTLAAMWAANFRPHWVDFDFAVWKEFVRGGLPFLGSTLTLTIRGQSDRLLLAALSSATAVGWYAAAWRVVSIPIFIPTLIMTPLLPALSRCAGIDERRVFVRTLHRSIEIMMLLMFPCSATLVAIAPSIPQLLHWGDAFDHSVLPIMLLAGQMVLIGPNMAFGTALVALHRERHWLGVMVASALLDVSLNLVLIPQADRLWENGALGATLATVITEVFILGVAIAILPRGMELWRLLPSVARLLVISGLQVAAIQVAIPVSPILALVASGLIWAAGVLVLRVISVADLHTGWGMVSEGIARKLHRAPRPA